MAGRTHPLVNLTLASAALLLAACQSSPARAVSPPPPTLESTVASLAREVIGRAALRTDLSSMRVCVHGLEGSASESALATPAAPDEATNAAVASELKAELVLALSGRLHLIDSSLSAGTLGDEADATLGARARDIGASHLVLGDYVRRGEELVVTVRLVDAESLVIVSAARGRVPIRLLSDRTYAALTSRSAPAGTDERAADPGHPSASQALPRIARADRPAPAESSPHTASYESQRPSPAFQEAGTRAEPSNGSQEPSRVPRTTRPEPVSDRDPDDVPPWIHTLVERYRPKGTAAKPQHP